MEAVARGNEIENYLQDGWQIDAWTLIDDDYVYWLTKAIHAEILYFCPNLFIKSSYDGEIYNNDCAICRLDDHKDEIVTECGHLFHIDCISAWFSMQGTCPMCLKKIADKIT